MLFFITPISFILTNISKNIQFCNPANFFSNSKNIITLIPIIRKFIRLNITQINRSRQNIHLPPRIIHIIFIINYKPNRPQKIGNRRPIRRPSPMPHMQWPCRISRNKLQQHPLPLTHIRQTIRITLLNNMPNHRSTCPLRHKEINKPSPRNLNLFHCRNLWKIRFDLLCQHLWCTFRLFRQHHRNIGRKIPLRFILRMVNTNIIRHTRQHAVLY
ncbi:hypothetical protein MNB_SUP05-SYMBIONT-7-25 [hydrothermal vent metagenome]|uniref:Uncharacterized protein n=1 Tax=hydrothermal vent metagenome TaxID=652676 RepID=A0A1W1E5N6_9ZZZZ